MIDERIRSPPLSASTPGIGTIATVHDLPYIRLDSSHPASRGEWNTPARRPSHLLRCESGGSPAILRCGDRVEQQWADPTAALDWISRNFPSAGRWVGFLNYDLGRSFETLPTSARDDLQIPLFAFAFIPDDAPPLDPPKSANTPSSTGTLTSSFTRDAYLAAVQRAIDYIAAGDIFQVNLSQRFAAPSTRSPGEVYQRLLDRSPAWYGGWLDFGDFAIVSNSPELFFRITPDRHIVTRPIKGTRPRAPGMEMELRDSLKDQAELNMIVDLERNDVGRISRIGSVKVIEPRRIEPHPTVFHGVATIRGHLGDEVGFVDVLRAMFPGGSITGAPKIRAMEIIEEMEPVRRGVYCGAIGYLDSRGITEFNIAIRTMTFKHGNAYMPVGGGIVADSQPVAEYDETLVKATAMFKALDIPLPNR